MNDIFLEFAKIAKHINKKFNITPVLYGSLGLGVITKQDLNPQDIDILIPKEYIFDKWNIFKESIEELGYMFVDLHEHEFRRLFKSIF